MLFIFGVGGKKQVGNQQLIKVDALLLNRRQEDVCPLLAMLAGDANEMCTERVVAVVDAPRTEALTACRTSKSMDRGAVQIDGPQGVLN